MGEEDPQEEKTAHGISEYPVAPIRAWSLLALCFFKLSCLSVCMGIFGMTLFQCTCLRHFKHSNLMSSNKNIFIHTMSLVIYNIFILYK